MDEEKTFMVNRRVSFVVAISLALVLIALMGIKAVIPTKENDGGPAKEPDRVARILEQVSPTYSKAVRIAALIELSSTTPDNPNRICNTLEKYAHETDEEIRKEVIATLGFFALKNKLPCPEPILLAFDDEERTVAVMAQGVAWLFPSLPKSSTKHIVEMAKSNDWEFRHRAASLLTHVEGNPPEVRAKLNEMKDDQNKVVRYEAILSYYQVTKDFKAFVTELLSCVSDPSAFPAAKTDEEIKDQTRRKLIQIGIIMHFHRLMKDRPEDVANDLIAHLSSPKENIRLAALGQIRVMCRASMETYRAIPKQKAGEAVAKLFNDKNDAVRLWASQITELLLSGPPAGTREKLQPEEIVRKKLYHDFGLQVVPTDLNTR